MRGYTNARTHAGWVVSVYRDGKHERSWRFRYKFQTWPVIWSLRVRGIRPL